MQLKLSPGGPFTETHAGPVKFEYQSWENSRWEGSIERLEDGKYIVRVNEEPLSAMELYQFSIAFGYISNGGRQ